MTHPARALVPLSLALALSGPARAQTPYLVKDINPQLGEPRSANLMRDEIATLNGFVLFAAEDPFRGRELWRSDGTPAGTHLLADINVGTAGSELHGFVVAGGRMFFGARDAEGVPRVWVTDGTPAGTQPTTLDVTHPAGMHAYGDEFLVTSTWVTTEGFYRSDGTPEGTIMLTDFRADDVLVRGADIYFTNYRGFWYSDGTPAGTTRLSYATAKQMVASPDVLYFITGNALYKHADEQTVEYIRNFPGHPIRQITLAGGLLFLVTGESATGHELWISDGTFDGTVLLLDIWPGPTGSDPAELTVIGDVVYFSAADPNHGPELWRSDGSVAGTYRVRDIMPGVIGSGPGDLLALGDRLYFAAGSPGPGRELWVSDGTEAGTQVVHNIMPGGSSSLPLPLGELNGELVLGADNGVVGSELWITDGTSAGTHLIADINAGAQTLGSDPADFEALGNTVLFAAAEPGAGRELWVSDGTTGGTALLSDIRPGPDDSGVSELLAIGEQVFFAAHHGGHYTVRPELWRTDGTPAGTALVRDIRPGNLGSHPSSFVDFNGVLVFVAGDGTGMKLWRSDGTEQGTILIGGGADDPHNLGAISDMLFFAAAARVDGSAVGIEPHRSDGTTAGTVLLADFRPGPPDSNPAFFTAVGDTIFFTARNGHRLYTTDGTAAGTVWTGVAPGGRMKALLDFNGLLVFRCGLSATGRELYRSDGTPAGTFMIKDIALGEASADPRAEHVLGSRIVFHTHTPELGRELWVSDGTEAGTQLLIDLVPGPVSGLAPESEIIPLRQRGPLLVPAATPDRGIELWMTDGTAAGTAPLGEVIPGPVGAELRGFTRAGPLLYFSAQRPEGDRELYALDLTALPIPCPADLTGDGRVDIADLGLVLSTFGQESDAADVNWDGVVTLTDLSAVLAAFGSDCD